MEYNDALNLALHYVTKKKEIESINTEASLNRVLAEDISCLRDLPPFNNSAMDGYAFKHKDITKALNIVDTILAGDNRKLKLNEGECFKIMTGAKVPNDCDTIAPREICEIKNNKVTIKKDIKLGNAIRLKGEEQKKGITLLKKGDLLTAPKIALLASQGIQQIKCYKELDIAIISTGNELKELNQKANEEELYNINGINIKTHLKQYGLDAKYIGVLQDNLEESKEMFKKLQKFDIIISTGGVSKGDADFTKQALLSNNFKEIFHGINIKPGHPVLIGKMKDSFVISLPGNPLAAIIQLIILALPIIFKARGLNKIYLETQNAIITEDLKLKPNRTNVVLGNLENGKFTSYQNNKYGSGMITPLVESNSLVIFNQNRDSVTKGSNINIIPLNSLAITDHYNYNN